jgi:hypothetical protein
MREIYNIFRAEVYNFQTDTLQVLWTLAESGESGPAIGPGETRVFYASVSGEISAAWPWTTPVPLVDYLAYDGPSLEANDYTAQVDVVVVKYDTLMKISITNNAAITLYMVRLMARGIPLLSSDPMIVIVEDATSKTKYGERTYPLPGKWIPSTSSAREYCEFLLTMYSEPIPVVILRFEANYSANMLAEVRDRDVSDLVTVFAGSATGLYINGEFFVESIAHSLRENGRHVVELKCSPSDIFGGFWVMGTNQLDIDAKLSY